MATSQYAFIAYRSSRSFFSAYSTQHVRTRRAVHDVVSAAVMLIGIVSWGAVLLLVAG